MLFRLCSAAEITRIFYPIIARLSQSSNQDNRCLHISVFTATWQPVTMSIKYAVYDSTGQKCYIKVIESFYSKYILFMMARKIFFHINPELLKLSTQVLNKRSLNIYTVSYN